MWSDLVSLYSLSGAVIKGYEQDVGTRTSFYGFTAFSLTQSLIILGSRGFQHVPLGKVSKEEWAWSRHSLIREHTGDKGDDRPVSGVWGWYGLCSHNRQQQGRQPGQAGGQQVGGLESEPGPASPQS